MKSRMIKQQEQRRDAQQENAKLEAKSETRQKISGRDKTGDRSEKRN